MNEKDFFVFTRALASDFSVAAAEIKQAAHDLHASVGQTYGDNLPYSVHLDMVDAAVADFADGVCQRAEDVLPLWFGAYFHDSIEDARFTYNDVRRMAQRYMDGQQAFMAAEIVYALTNEKGRNRAERANEKYYAGIRATPYAPFVKLADRLANMRFSSAGTDEGNRRMCRVYRDELPHFLQAICQPSDDPRLALPPAMVQAVKEIC